MARLLAGICLQQVSATAGGGRTARPRLVTLPALAFSDDAPLELWIDPDAAQEPEVSGP
jgi:hypothetical protein